MFSRESSTTGFATGAARGGGDPSTELEFLRREGNDLSPRGGGDLLSRRRRGGEREGERESYDADRARRRGGERERLILRFRAGEGESRPPLLRGGGDGERE
jgi:hypothetical protein